MLWCRCCSSCSGAYCCQQLLIALCRIVARVCLAGLLVGWSPSVVCCRAFSQPGAGCRVSVALWGCAAGRRLVAHTPLTGRVAGCQQVAYDRQHRGRHGAVGAGVTCPRCVNGNNRHQGTTPPSVNAHRIEIFFAGWLSGPVHTVVPVKHDQSHHQSMTRESHHLRTTTSTAVWQRKISSTRLVIIRVVSHCTKQHAHCALSSSRTYSHSCRHAWHSPGSCACSGVCCYSHGTLPLRSSQRLRRRLVLLLLAVLLQLLTHRPAAGTPEFCAGCQLAGVLSRLVSHAVTCGICCCLVQLACV